MATLILSSVGTAIGGPLGGTIGTIIGARIDQEIFGGGDREGPRLTDLAVQTSQYGALVPRIYGHMRVAGTVIWATDLIERSERQSGGKGNPGTVQFAYSVSMAVALSSRPIKNIKRIWAEGNLLRGAAGDFKSQTGFRFYNGHGNQPPDPLIAALEGDADTPAYRGMAYCVFEELDLTDFGNRIPSLTFEIEADDGQLSPRDIMADVMLLDNASENQPQEMLGYSAQADRQVQMFEDLTTAFPHHADWTRDGLRITRRDLASSSDALVIKQRDILHQRDAEAEQAEQRTEPRLRAMQIGLRYYEPERDYQAGIRRSINGGTGRAPTIFDMPAALRVSDAQNITQRLYRYSQYQDHERTLYMARLDPDLRPGRTVTIEGEAALWRIMQWRFSSDGIALNLVRDNSAKTALTANAAESGRSNKAPDRIAIGAGLQMLNLPARQDNMPSATNLFAAARAQDEASQPDSGLSAWRGGTLYRAAADNGLLDLLTPMTSSADFGALESALPPANGLHCNGYDYLAIRFAGDDPLLSNIDAQSMANGENLILVGQEVIQFMRADYMGDKRYRLSHLYRALGDGNGGQKGHESGAQCVLLNRKVQRIALPDNIMQSSINFALVSRGVDTLSYAQSDVTRALRPLAPVHLQWHNVVAKGQAHISWTRRSRLPFRWSDGIDIPLVEERERYEVAFWRAADMDTGPDGQTTSGTSPLLTVETEAPYVTLDADQREILHTEDRGIIISVRQTGTHFVSEPANLLMPQIVSSAA